MVDDSTLAGSGFASAAANDPEQLENCRALAGTLTIWPPLDKFFLANRDCALFMIKLAYNTQSKRCVILQLDSTVTVVLCMSPEDSKSAAVIS
jgi:hypothetical protein